MATLDRTFQPMVKDVGKVLVGVAQIRVGKPSIRDVGTGIVKAAQFVGISNKLTDTTTGASIDYIQVGDMSTGGTLPAGCTLATAGSYDNVAGIYDGCFIIRATNATTVDIFGPNGYKDAAVSVSSFASTPKDMKLGDSATSGVTIEGVLATSITAGQTWVIPVWSGAAQDKVQTGIVSPYSLFSGSNESVGGLKSSSFSPKLDSIKTLETGFPAITADQLVEKTSVEVDFSCNEFTNDNLAYLQNMMSQVINDAELPSISVEMVARTRDNTLYSFWMPNCNLTSLPAIAPVNDYSDMAYKLTAVKATEISGESAAYNVWLDHAPIYQQLSYKH